MGTNQVMTVNVPTVVFHFCFVLPKCCVGRCSIV